MTSGSGYDDVVIIRLKIQSYTGQIKPIVGSKYRLRYVYLIAHSVSTVYCLTNLCVCVCVCVGSGGGFALAYIDKHFKTDLTVSIYQVIVLH